MTYVSHSLAPESLIFPGRYMYFGTMAEWPPLDAECDVDDRSFSRATGIVSC
jgi:hypothetical protein